MRAFPEKVYGSILLSLIPALVLGVVVVGQHLGVFQGISRFPLVVLSISSTLVSGFYLLMQVRGVGQRLGEIEDALDRFHKGDFSQHLVILRGDLFRSLALSVKQVGRSMERRLRRSEEHFNQERAIFETLREGIVLLDTDQRILKLNATAAKIFDVAPGWALERRIEEVIRAVSLHRLVERGFREGGEHQAEIVLVRNDTEWSLLATIREVAEGGARLLVLNDVTDLRRLENIRRDFIANLSHELRTPVTAISGFVETLRDGAIDNKTEALRFLDIIYRQAQRLTESFQDLLTLSRLEREEERGEFELTSTDIVAVVHRSVESLRKRALERKMHIHVSGPATVPWMVNGVALEQALSNLIENAIKYSVEGDSIEVSVASSDDQATISVRDHGKGIEDHHQSRVFERFYRVDKGRNRKEGGTGLGLSIVKHVAQAHGGNVTLESRVGHGCLFVIALPRHEAKTVTATP